MPTATADNRVTEIEDVADLIGSVPCGVIYGTSMRAGWFRRKHEFIEVRHCGEPAARRARFWCRRCRQAWALFFCMLHYRRLHEGLIICKDCGDGFKWEKDL